MKWGKEIEDKTETDLRPATDHNESLKTPKQVDQQTQRLA
jgi:hypothetical protein